MLANTTDTLVEPLDATAAKVHLTVEHSDDDAYITLLCSAARELIEDEIAGPVPLQDYTLTLDRFPVGEFELPKHPVTEIVSIAYVDADGNNQAVAVIDTVLTNPEEGLRSTLKPTYGNCWPDVEAGFNQVTITFKAGYLPDDIPEKVIQAIKLILSGMYRDRAETSQMKTHPVALNACALVRRLKQHR